MKAVVYEKYGSPDVLELKEVEKPLQGEGEVRPRLSGISAKDVLKEKSL